MCGLIIELLRISLRRVADDSDRRKRSILLEAVPFVCEQIRLRMDRCRCGFVRRFEAIMADVRVVGFEQAALA